MYLNKQEINEKKMIEWIDDH